MLMVNLPEEKLWDKVNCLLSQYGQEALQFSKNYVLQEKIEYEPLSEALRFFFESWFDVLHPTLIALSCEAVGGNKNQTVKLGAAVVLLAGAADIHDDIMDQSKSKESNLTVYGKFGQDIAILAGDTLLLKGIYLLHEGCETLQKNNQKEIFGSIKQAFFEMSSGVAREANLRGKTPIPLTEFLSIIKQKVATVEATMRIGAIIGGGSDEEISILSNYGRTYGMLLSLRDEFVDVFEADEIKNRLANECLPLPVLLALQDKSNNKLLNDLLKEDITPENVEKVVDLSLDCQASRELIAQMKHMIEQEIVNLTFINKHKEILMLLLDSTVEDL
jgi:geranylgeranyl diphosphate synthase type I